MEAYSPRVPAEVYGVRVVMFSPRSYEIGKQVACGSIFEGTHPPPHPPDFVVRQ